MSKDFNPTKAAAAGHWPEIARCWAQIGSPLRPVADDIGFFTNVIDRWRRGSDRPPRALILGVTPHVDRVGSPVPQSTRASRAARYWAASMLANLSNSECLPVLSRGKAIPRLAGHGGTPGYATGHTVSLSPFLLDDHMRRSGLHLDWRAI